MRTKALGYSITDIPGLAEIRIEESEHSDQGVHIVLDDGTGEITAERSYGIEELAELQNALTEAVHLARRLAQQVKEQD